MHLLTKEAMLLYYRHLKPNGILAVHISNRYLDLKPVVDGIARDTGHVTRLIANGSDDDILMTAAVWVLVTAERPGFDATLMDSSIPITPAKRPIRMWTDEYSNLFQILR